LACRRWAWGPDPPQSR